MTSRDELRAALARIDEAKAQLRAMPEYLHQSLAHGGTPLQVAFMANVIDALRGKVAPALDGAVDALCAGSTACARRGECAPIPLLQDMLQQVVKALGALHEAEKELCACLPLAALGMNGTLAPALFAVIERFELALRMLGEHVSQRSQAVVRARRRHPLGFRAPRFAGRPGPRQRTSEVSPIEVDAALRRPA